jgi:hypothetical protein
VFSARAKAVSRRKFFLQSLLWGSFAFLMAGLVATAQDTAQPAPTTPPAAEVIQEIVETSESLPIPEPAPPPAPEPSPPQEVPEKTPDATAFAAPKDVEVAPTAQPPVRGADVAFPTPSGASTNEPLVMFGRPVAKVDYGGSGNRDASRLRSMPPQNFTFDRSSLRDVLRLLAEDAGIPYVGIPEHSPKAQRLVTFKMTASPFAALEAVCRQNDIKLTYQDGVWFMGVGDANLERARKAEQENELIGVVYQLKYDPVDVVDFKGGGGGGAGGAGGGAAAGASSATTPQLPLQYSQRVFEAKAPRIVNEIRVMLGMKPLDYGDAGQVTDPETTAGTEGQSAGIPPFDGEIAAGGGGNATAGQGEAQSLFPVYIPPQKPQVIYNSDTNILWVVATRKQHKWVADYLSRVDKPQDLIAIEVKFFETNKNPQTDFGINWENALGGDGLTFNATASAQPAGVIENGSATFSAPYSAVLTMNQASVAIQAFTRDREGSLVQYPRVLTINNREVAITSAENTPINSGVQNVSSGNVGGQNVGSLEYLPTGTQINILPKAVGKNQIALTVAITISSIIDQVPINLGTGVNQYPVTAERVYNASLQVNSGYTLAVGGLEKSNDLRSTGGVPLLKDIPGVGYLFKNKTRNRTRSNLIIFITPYVIDDPARTPGISETPESTIPVRPGVPPPAPNFSPDGALIGGQGALPGAFTWLEYQLKYFRQINKEARDDAKTINELRSVIQRARALSNHLQAQVMEGAGYAPMVLLDNSARADALLVELNKVLAAAQLDQFQLQQGFP